MLPPFSERICFGLIGSLNFQCFVQPHETLSVSGILICTECDNLLSLFMNHR